MTLYLKIKQIWTGSALGKLVLGFVIIALCFLSGVLVTLHERANENADNETETKSLVKDVPVAAKGAITLATLNNLAYRIDDRIYQLKEGKAESDSDQQNRDGNNDDELLKGVYLDKHVVGDLRGHGVTDAMVILLGRTGGTGSYYYLAPVLNDKEKIHTPSNAFFIGDRVQIKQLSLKDGIVTVKLVMHGPDDGGCCPTLERTLRFVFKENTLQCTTEPCSEY